MNKDFCIVVFSHADNIEKDEILFKSLNSIRRLDLNVILASHIDVSDRNRNLCDYFIKDDNNLIISESDIFNNQLDIHDNLYNTTDFFGGVKFETYVYKKNYQAGVFNLYISSFKLAKQLGFKNIILWEYDYILGEISYYFIKSNIQKFLDNGLESISFESTIRIFNNDIVQKEIPCCYAIPVFFNIDRFLSIMPSKSIENTKEYLEISKLMIMEQWIKINIINNCNPRLEYAHDDYSRYLPDTEVGKVDSQSANYLFLGLRSGIYFNEYSACFSLNNVSINTLKCIFTIYDSLNIPIYHRDYTLGYMCWFYDILNEDISDIMRTDTGCKVIEIIEDIDSGKIDTFEYIINKDNIDFISKLKKYSICD